MREDDSMILPTHYYRPDPACSITALACSILRHYGLPACNSTLPVADALLARKPRNIILLLADGLGTSILNQHLEASGYLRRNQIGALSSVFPPTTTAAATALESGLYPAQSGWLGWSVYWPELDCNVNLYPNTLSNGSPAADVHLGYTYLRVRSLVEQIAGAGFSAAALEGQTLLHTITEQCSQPGQHFIYGYWNEPDHLIHQAGCTAASVTAYLQSFERALCEAVTAWPDCLVFLTADHGMMDLERRCLDQYPLLERTLRLPPSIEPRAWNCFVRPGMHDSFRQAIQKATDNTYRILSREEVLSGGLFGPPPLHPQFSAMLGDYLAIATTPLTLFPNRAYLQSMVAGHGGLTTQELTVPLIVLDSLKHSCIKT